MSEIRTIANLLDDDGPVALIIKQPLAPVDDDDPVIFPPTYPITDWKGRVHTIRDGDYRVTVEIPTGSKVDKDDNKDNQRPGYQIDRFPDGTNICEIDSPQSQSNRIEPKFKKIDDGKLVPQITIRVGNEQKNLLDVGHRAGDALVRMSSLAADIHEAFTSAKSGNFCKLATLAPTSLVFGVWDSRSTQVKQQRAFKAYVRATNVREISRSAQYAPALAYVDSGAVSEQAEKKEGTETNFSQEGMVHALSVQKVGGVMLTADSRLVRSVNVNLEAIRALRGTVPTTGGGASVDCTTELRNYIVGLALVAAFHEPDLNLREGCNLRRKSGESGSAKLVYRSKSDEECSFSWDDVLNFAQEAKKAFFQRAGIQDDAIDRPDATFEKGVAEWFLGHSKTDRDKIRKLGPITTQTRTRFEEVKKKGDPIEKLRKEIAELTLDKTGKKLKGVSKLKKEIESLQEDDLKKQLLGVLETNDEPASMKQKLSELLPPTDETAANDQRGEEGNASDRESS